MTDRSTHSMVQSRAVWPGLYAQPSGVKARVSAPVARLLLRRVADRLGFSISEDGHTQADMMLRRPREFYSRLGADGLIGLGESYMTGAWDSDDLGGLLTLLCSHITDLVPQPLQHLRGLYMRARPVSERNSRSGARGNVGHHYDLSHALFASFLDPTLSYSSAMFGQDGQPRDLEEAQIYKTERILDQARVGPATRLLEIGTGWGELAIRAARRGASVRSITLSTEQRDFVAGRVAAEGLGDRINIDLCDYRDLDGSDRQYDAVVSVEMIEAVGKEYLASYFQQIDTLLAGGGRAVLQVITMPHERMLQTQNTWTWITKYIFPGGFLPSLDLLAGIVEHQTCLQPVDAFAFGTDYATTLAEWDKNFLAAGNYLRDQGFDDTFRRMWHFYLQYSRAGFAADYLDVNQLTLEKS